ncbi:hypothetical protein CWO84_09930 [Methylomonas sp. Kb3]|uniref:hypothetical protein n=1 Tax=Methylomonas sp. Kb3 TaxID=1611544 RepID=UPI000C34403F|nr:hypothetical protein [Methylomonas sp. Kb3]PKD40451.1 hypothetical protein CWO84_09930 [Methylomonas sp. Kb3]
MSRALKDDYSNLVEFINSYTLKDAYSDGDFDSAIKPMHKGYYAALVIMAELEHQGAQPVTPFSKAQKEVQTKIFWSYLTESFSELGSSFFLILNGCYKAAEQVLRSSIENFVKAHGSLDNEGLHQVKNVYEVFEISGATSFFSKGIGRDTHIKLNELYVNLCSSVHTGTEQDMQRISALGEFPAIDRARVLTASKKYLKIVKLYVSSLSVMFSEVFHKMHHKNRDIVTLSLSEKALQALHVK